jgi:hypothetical protein
VAALILAGMALLAGLTLVYALNTESVRRGHDFHKPPPHPLTVPFIVRFALGVYVFALMYALVRGWTRRDTPAPPSVKTTWFSRWTIPVVALIGLLLVVLVIQTSQKPEPEPEPTRGRLTVAATAPADLPGLAYLPVDTDMAAAVHVAEVMQTDAGKQAVALLELVAKSDVESWTGLKTEDVDHLVIGFDGSKGFSEGTLVVRTRQPYNLAEIRKAFASRPMPQHGHKPVYSLAPRKDTNALLWCADERTLVVVFKVQGQPDFGAVPTKPRAGKDRLPPPLLTLFQERPLGSGNPVWLAGSSPDAGVMKQLLSALPLGPANGNVLSRLRSVRAGLRFDPVLAVNADLETQDAASAEELERLLRRRKGKGTALKVIHKPGDKWVSVEAKFQGEAWGKMLAKP